MFARKSLQPWQLDQSHDNQLPSREKLIIAIREEPLRRDTNRSRYAPSILMSRSWSFHQTILG